MKPQKTSITYRIERKPEGGFIARSADPSMPAIEAPTREELSQKIQAEVLGKALPPNLKLPLENGLSVLDVLRTEHKPGRMLVFSSTNGDTGIEQPNQEQMEQFAKQFGGIVAKNFPEIEKALAARIGDAAASKQAPEAVGNANSPTLSGIATPFSNAPITPESNHSWKVFMVLLGLVAAGAAMYFFFYHR
jgi:hypothetical protein